MPANWILKLPQVDKPDHPILIHVRPKEGDALDLDLLATDGEEAFRGKGTDEEWMALLHYVLISRRNSSAKEEQTKNLEVDCSISNRASKAALSITLRSRIEDITHKLGTIELLLSNNTDDVDLFGWACQLVSQRDQYQDEAMHSEQAADSSKSTIAALRTQLDDLIKAKIEHEDQLLTKFVALLNEKKLKIRNQQRVLQTAKVDREQLDEMQLFLDGKHNLVESTKRKRSDITSGVDDDDPVDEDESADDSEGFETMNVDGGVSTNLHDRVNSRRETPPRADSAGSATASEDESDIMQVTTGNVSQTRSSKLREASPPPVRSLPFQKKGQKDARIATTKAPIPPTAGENQDTESEDDEL